MQIDYGIHVMKRLLFVDNPKLLATNNLDLERMAEETLRFFKVVGLETNCEKSVTNSAVYSGMAVQLKGTQGYKYLDMIETSRGRPMQESFDQINRN